MINKNDTDFFNQDYNLNNDHQLNITNISNIYTTDYHSGIYLCYDDTCSSTITKYMNEQILESIDLKEIEQFIRQKKLKNIADNNNSF